MRIELDPERLLAFGVTADEVPRSCAPTTPICPAAGADRRPGAIDPHARRRRQRRGAWRTRIVLPDGRSVRLDDLGSVSDAPSDLASVARFNGQPVVAFMVQRAKGSSEVRVFDAMEAKLKEIEAADPGVRFQLIGTPVDFVRGMHESSIAALFEGALLACVGRLSGPARLARDADRGRGHSARRSFPTFAAIEPLGFYAQHDHADRAVACGGRAGR